MNFEVIEEASFYGNTKVAENLGITFPEKLTSSAKELFTEILNNLEVLIIMTLIMGILKKGLIYAIMALRSLYHLQDPGLSGLVRGLPPSHRAALSASAILSGVHPAAALFCPSAPGPWQECVTGFIHVKLKVRDLLSGIIVMTGLYPLNLRIAGGRANAYLYPGNHL